MSQESFLRRYRRQQQEQPAASTTSFSVPVRNVTPASDSPMMKNTTSARVARAQELARSVGDCSVHSSNVNAIEASRILEKAGPNIYAGRGQGVYESLPLEDLVEHINAEPARLRKAAALAAKELEVYRSIAAGVPVVASDATYLVAVARGSIRFDFPGERLRIGVELPAFLAIKPHPLCGDWSRVAFADLPGDAPQADVDAAIVRCVAELVLN